MSAVCMISINDINPLAEILLSMEVNCMFLEIPSPTRKKGSVSSQHEDCVVPDIDDEDDVFKFDRPNIPTGSSEMTSQTYFYVITYLAFFTLNI